MTKDDDDEKIPDFQKLPVILSDKSKFVDPRRLGSLLGIS
jgi:hypothetical protein